MYCNCKNVNNYQVIGLCDVENFPTPTTGSWTQITVPEILPLPDCYPEIENIERIYVKVGIESTKIINTPTPSATNVEGDMLTGKKLIVDGVICQTVVYTANTCEQSLHSINFKYPFCAAIVLDTTDEATDYCIQSCIENVYARKINDRTIFKSVTLFLNAEPISGECPEIPDPDDPVDPETEVVEGR